MLNSNNNNTAGKNNIGAPKMQNKCKIFYFSNIAISILDSKFFALNFSFSFFISFLLYFVPSSLVFYSYRFSNTFESCHSEG